jgi:hypothetical protein
MPRKTTRLYYGLNEQTGERLYWVLKVTNATKPVKLNGSVLDAMKGKPGLSIGCHLSQTAKTNKDCFPHPVVYVSFTRTVALVVTEIKNGAPTKCVRYRHNYSFYVDLNDKDPTKTLVQNHPHLFNRQFTLSPYKETKQPAHWKPEYGRQQTGKRNNLGMMYGEMRRLYDAGLVRANLTS